MKKLETIVLATLVFAFLTALSPSAALFGIHEKVTRLHIMANSDSDSDQWLKLSVRDALLAGGFFSENSTANQSITAELLGKIEDTARKTLRAQGCDDPVYAEVTDMFFDTRVYEGFALPAGKYKAIRIIIGEGRGKNWWCVMFPPLCAPLAQGTAEEIAKKSGLTGDEIAFITKDGTAFAVKFKVAELWGNFINKFE